MAIYEPAPNRRAVAGQMVFFIVWLAVTLIGAYLTPNRSGHGTHTQLGLPPCPSAFILGRPCPGCGLTTSWTATIHGRWAEAFQAHPLGPFLYLGFTVAALLALRGWWSTHRLETNTTKFNYGLVAFAVVFFGFGIWRMLTVTDYRSLSDVTAMGLTKKAS